MVGRLIFFFSPCYFFLRDVPACSLALLHIPFHSIPPLFFRFFATTVLTVDSLLDARLVCSQRGRKAGGESEKTSSVKKTASGGRRAADWNNGIVNGWFIVSLIDN